MPTIYTHLAGVRCISTWLSYRLETLTLCHRQATFLLTFVFPFPYFGFRTSAFSTCPHCTIVGRSLRIRILERGAAHVGRRFSFPSIPSHILLHIPLHLCITHLFLREQISSQNDLHSDSTSCLFPPSVYAA